MSSYHFHVTSVLEAPYPLRALIICCCGGWGSSSSGCSRRPGRPSCSSSPTIAGFSPLFSPFGTIHVGSSCISVSSVFLLRTLASRYLAASLRCFKWCFYSFIVRFTSFVAANFEIMCFSFRPGLFLFSPLVIFHVPVHGFVPSPI